MSDRFTVGTLTSFAVRFLGSFSPMGVLTTQWSIYIFQFRRKGSEKSRIMQEFVVFFAGYSATCIEYRLVVR